MNFLDVLDEYPPLLHCLDVECRHLTTNQCLAACFVQTGTVHLTEVEEESSEMF